MTVLVVGPESSGTRLVTRLVAGLGVVAVHRSLPHGSRWPKLPEVDATVVVVRDWWATISSQSAAGHAPTRLDAEDRLRFAWKYLMDHIRTPWVLVTYESLVADPEGFVVRIADWLGVSPVPSREDVYDGNEKWLSRR